MCCVQIKVCNKVLGAWNFVLVCVWFWINFGHCTQKHFTVARFSVTTVFWVYEVTPHHLRSCSLGVSHSSSSSKPKWPFRVVAKMGCPKKQAPQEQVLPSTVPQCEGEAMLLLCLVTWHLKENKAEHPVKRGEWWSVVGLCPSGSSVRMPALAYLVLG